MVERGSDIFQRMRECMRCAHRSVVVRGTDRGPALWLAIAALAGSACGDASPAECAQLDRQIADQLAMPGSCQTDADCSVIGGQLNETCDCATYVVRCEGLAIENNAPGLPRARALIQQFVSAGCPATVGCAFDCAPLGRVHCTADHRCTAPEQSCLPPPPDAGVDAPDASALEGPVSR